PLRVAFVRPGYRCGCSKGLNGGIMKRHKHHQETEAVRGSADLHKKNGPLSTPIYQTSTFEVTDSEQQLRATHTDMFYTRYGNPTNTVAENAIAELEGADGALLYSESPTNPLVRVVDLKKIVALAKQHDLLTMIDSTFATPINQRPCDFGIDLVMHSGTKYYAGHSDLIAGIIAGRRDLIEKIHETRTTLGGNMDPHAAWLLLRGIKTLAVRVQRQNENALRIAQFLSHHAKVQRVHYPFLESHPQRALAMDQMVGGGGVLSFEVDGSGEDARRLVEALNLFTLAPSLGGVDSLVTIPVLT